MTNTIVHLIHFLSILSFSSLLLTASAQTNSTDVDALRLLEAAFDSVSTSDPCLPTPYPWLECSSGETPRIIALNLNGAGLVTLVPLPDFTAMDALEIIDFGNNFLEQDFPDFFANFPNLKVLNLANNFLFGTIPTSLREKLDGKTLELTLTGAGMTNLCFSDEDTCTGTETIAGESFPSTHFDSQPGTATIGGETFMIPSSPPGTETINGLTFEQNFGLGGVRK